MTDQAKITVNILAQHRLAALHKLEKLAKRGAKYDQSIVWTERAYSETVKRVRWDGDKVDVVINRIEIAIVGAAPRVGNFKFLAQLEAVPGGVIVSAVPGVEVGPIGREWNGQCEHCAKPRARKQAFVVEGPDGRKVVGKSCLRDYLGTDDPAAAIAAFTLFDDLSAVGGNDDEGGYGGYGQWQESTLGVLAAARAAIALWGWRPASQEGMSTAGYADLALTAPRGKDHWADERKMIERELKERGDHYQAAAEAIVEWGANLVARGDYEWNLKVALNSEVVITKTRNLVISAAAAFDRQVAHADEVKAKREAEAARNAALPPSYHVGKVGERVTSVVTVEKAIGLPDRGFGPSTLYVLRADDGAVFKWFTSAGAPRVNDQPIEVGNHLVVTATVKKHGEYEGQKETMILRAKFAPNAREKAVA